MIRTMALHNVNMDNIAACERWYWDKHGPQLYRRYEPWLVRFESFRAIVPFETLNQMLAENKGKDQQTVENLIRKYGITNWMATSGYWREIPESGPKGEMALSSPPEHAYSFGIAIPPQSTEDYKGSQFAPEEKAPIRWVQHVRCPKDISKEEFEKWFQGVLAPFVCDSDEVFRFFSFKAIDEDVRFPGEWKAETFKDMKGGPEDHQWDRMTEMWFESFNDWKSFIYKLNKCVALKPDWAIRTEYPYVAEKDFVSAFLLERPAYNWKYENHTFL